MFFRTASVSWREFQKKPEILLMTYLTQIFLLLLISIFLNAFAADCVTPPTLSQQPIYFYNHYLGVYTIYLSQTLTAIKEQSAQSGPPFYQKIWYGDCPVGLSGPADSCVEYTVYPNAENFMPGDIMQKIEQYTDNGEPNRGEVRILTDQNNAEYVYTIDHEKTFCGPYPIGG